MRLRPLASIAGVTCFIALSLLVFPAPPAAACSCAASSADDHLERADVAFLGDVVAEWIADPDSVIQGEARLASPEMIYMFMVREVYKGAARERQLVMSSLDGASCGAGLRVNHRYVVYAREAGALADGRPVVRTGLCDGTHQPDGVNGFALDGGRPVTHGAGHDGKGGWYGVPAGESIAQPGVSPAALGGLMLLSTAIAGAAIVLAGRT